VTTSPAVTEELIPQSLSFARSALLMGLAFLWSGVAIAVLLGYHLAEPHGVTSITTNGFTYVGNPPALTLFERDPVSFSIIAVTLGVGLSIGLVDHIVRSRQRSGRVGAAAIVAGAAVLLVSLFGSLPGIVGVGVVGGLLIASGFSRAREQVQ
jgi:hypothetical protein